MAQSGLSMSVNDVLQTDWQVLCGILDLNQEAQSEQVVDLFDFIGELDG